MIQKIEGLRVAGLFAGIAGVELGLDQAGHETVYLCEIDEAAKRVLRAHYGEDVPLDGDIRYVKHLPDVDLITAGFPCQDLSQAGRTAGIKGRSSGLVNEVFRLLEDADPTWLLLENVPFMLSLDKGQAMTHLTHRLAELGFSWAYRVVDSRAFGLPQRRQRVLLLASRTQDPRGVLFGEDIGPPDEPSHEGRSCGFYWTEGTRGLGWAVEAVPTLKGGSTVGIPSPPAIWFPDGRIVTPDIRDAERMQGFESDWTLPAVEGDKRRNGPRWKLVGNAVSVPVARWIGERLLCAHSYNEGADEPLYEDERWPKAAWWIDGNLFKVNVSAWPRREKREPLCKYLKFNPRPLSERATAGFLRRANSPQCRLRFVDGFKDALRAHADRMRQTTPVT